LLHSKEFQSFLVYWLAVAIFFALCADKLV
jgi:hypothetical protein